MHYDMEDLLEQANEIQETLGRSYAVPDEIDEADLEAGQLALSLFRRGDCLTPISVVELDALALEEEEEGPSYLADLNKMPDFIDEAPIESGQVRILSRSRELVFVHLQYIRRQNGQRQSRRQARCGYICSLYVWYCTSTEWFGRHDMFLHELINHIGAPPRCLQTNRRSFWFPPRSRC